MLGPFYSNARFGISFGIIGALEEAIRVTRDYAMERYVSTTILLLHQCDFAHTQSGCFFTVNNSANLWELSNSYRRNWQMLQWRLRVRRFLSLSLPLRLETDPVMGWSVGLVSCVQLGRLKDSKNWSRREISLSRFDVHLGN